MFDRAGRVEAGSGRHVEASEADEKVARGARSAEVIVRRVSREVALRCEMQCGREDGVAEACRRRNMCMRKLSQGLDERAWMGLYANT